MFLVGGPSLGGLYYAPGPFRTLGSSRTFLLA